MVVTVGTGGFCDDATIVGLLVLIIIIMAITAKWPQLLELKQLCFLVRPYPNSYVCMYRRPYTVPFAACHSSASMRHSEKKPNRTRFFRSSDVECPAGMQTWDAKQHHWWMQISTLKQCAKINDSSPKRKRSWLTYAITYCHVILFRVMS